MSTIAGEIDVTYITQQRGMFASGLVATIGVSGYAVWMAVKSHADFANGEAWCGVRRLAEMTGLGPSTVARMLKVLQEEKLLRVVRQEGQKLIYVARERMDVRIGSRVIATVAIDYVPLVMRERLEKLKREAATNFTDADIWTWVDLYPGEGLEWDPVKRRFTGKMRADEVPVVDEPGFPGQLPNR